MNNNEIHIISLGAGVQSSSLLLMSAIGVFGEENKPKIAIFADTGWEPVSVYQYLDWLEKEAEKHGIRIVRTSRGNIREDMLNKVRHGTRAANIPLFTLDENGKKGIITRQCTNDYKIMAVRREIRKQLGYGPRDKVREQIVLYMGISTDEFMRAKESRVNYIKHYFPLLEHNFSRQDCLNWMKEQGYPLPPRSSCIGCPFHSDKTWLQMKRNDPEAWADAVEFDKEIRNFPGLKGKAYLHKSCKPLDEVIFNENEQLDLFNNECEGMCGL